MLTKETAIGIVKQVTGLEQVQMNTEFASVGIDSTVIVELIIEFELMFDIDALDAELNLDSLKTVKDLYDYIHLILNKRGGE